MLDNSLVSIIMPTYNSSLFIENSINSILKQSYRNFELLITDDNSTDNTVFLIRKYINLDTRIKLFQNDKNYGAAISRNISLKFAKGRFIAFCDSDDIWVDDKLIKQINFLKFYNIAFTFSSYNRILNNKFIGVVTPPFFLTYKKLLRYCPIGTSTVIYDTKIIPKMEFPNFRTRQDYALWLILFQTIGHTYSMKEPLVNYNVSDTSLSSNKFKAAYFHFYVLRKVTKINLLFLFYNFIIYVIRGIYIHLISKYLRTVFNEK